ncbi:MAG: EVE domain-containing protein [Deltaproteobacteria bacterium]|nr:EVE domain-containing protein [Deltaproteobacteria bacterium]
MPFFLMKTEPDVFSIDDLKKKGKTSWDGVRNYMARNHMRAMRRGDLVLIYHSNADPSGVVGVGRVVKEAHPDLTAQDPKSDYFDPKATPESPRWDMVDVAFEQKLPRIVSLAEMKRDSALAGMEVTKKGSRLSVHPVLEAHFKHVLELGRSG